MHAQMESSHLRQFCNLFQRAFSTGASTMVVASSPQKLAPSRGRALQVGDLVVRDFALGFAGCHARPLVHDPLELERADMQRARPAFERKSEQIRGEPRQNFSAGMRWAAPASVKKKVVLMAVQPLTGTASSPGTGHADRVSAITDLTFLASRRDQAAEAGDVAIRGASSE